MRVQRFAARVVAGPRGHGIITVPFDPDEVWGAKAEHAVNGTIDGRWLRGKISPEAGGWVFTTTPMWMRDAGIPVGSEVTVELAPEGPQRADLAGDIAAALAASPAAAAFFDTLAQFYRKAYLRYVDATTRRPQLRAARIAEVVDLLAAGVKERPLSRPQSSDSLRDLVIAGCGAKPGAVEDYPFGAQVAVFKVGGKMFALVSLDASPGSISLKCDPDLAVGLRSRHAAITAGYHLNKRHWNTVVLDGSVSHDELTDLIDHSYELVVAGLPKAERDALT